MIKCIVLFSDYVDIELCKFIVVYVVECGYEVIDIGLMILESIYYFKYGCEVVEMIVKGEVDLGILICGMGQGIMMFVNKVEGICCGVCFDVFFVKMICVYNNVQMLFMGVCVIGVGFVMEIVDVFLDIEFEGGCYVICVDMIEV